MPSIRAVKFEWRNGSIYGNQFDAFALTERGQRAFSAACDAIEDEIQAAGLEAEKVRGTVHVSGETARVTWHHRHGLDTLSVDAVDEYKDA